MFRHWLILRSYLIKNQTVPTTSWKSTPVLVANERQGDEVDRLGWFQEDVIAELIVINDIRCVVCLVTNYEEVIETSLRLNVTEVRFNDVHEINLVFASLSSKS